ncbi:MAG: hypothetical protein U1F51_11660 [Burkholderiales bacterium]
MPRLRSIRALLAALDRQREGDPPAGVEAACGQRTDHGAGQIAERVQQRGGDESGDQEGDENPSDNA